MLVELVLVSFWFKFRMVKKRGLEGEKYFSLFLF